MNPTEEQAQAVALAKRGDDLKMVAYAGTGKTTTLRMVSEALSPKSGTYVAFNREIAHDAKRAFPNNVDCRTAHSLAYQAMDVGRTYRTKLAQRLTAREICRILAISPNGYAGRTQANVARAILATVGLFQYSADTKIGPEHIPMKHLQVFNLTDAMLGPERLALTEAREAFIRFVCRGAWALWEKMIDPRSPVAMQHDTYVKLWQLSEPYLSSDFILVDEAQDLNPVLQAIVQAQQGQLIWVGDPHQQIYSWRGAVNAMQSVEADTTYLTQSFRWGPEVANVANAILELKGKLPHPVLGHPDKPTQLVYANEPPETIISRGNGAIFAKAIECIDSHRRLCVIGSLEPALKRMESGYALWSGNHAAVKDPELQIFQTWEELVDASDEDRDLEQVVKYVTQYTTGIPGMVAKLRAAGEVEESHADLILTTTHKAKGREWANVSLASDFPSHLQSMRQGRPVRTEEVNVLYVAATRGKERLVLNAQARELLDSDLIAEAQRVGRENPVPWRARRS